MPLVLLRQFVFVAFFLIDTFNWWNYFLGDAFGPGYSGLAAARLLLRNEPSPTYPYRNFCFWVLIKFFGEFFLSDTFRCWWDNFLMKLCFLVELFFGRCLRPGLLRARLRSVIATQ